MEYEEIEEKKLSLDDSFEFSCRQCGKCCRNRDDIILSAMDLRRIADWYGRDERYIIERYCEYYIGHTSMVPIVVLKSVGSQRACPFLRDRRCAIHSVKPNVCQLYPLGHAYSPTTGEDFYFNMDVSCGKPGQEQKVSEWVKHREDEKEAFNAWNAVLTEAHEVVTRMKEKGRPLSALHRLWDELFVILYLGYTDRDMVDQLEGRRRNIAAIRGRIEDL